MSQLRSLVLALASVSLSSTIALSQSALTRFPEMWTGAYVGAHTGYSWGHSERTGGPSVDLFRPFDLSRGTGSYDVGLHAGYNWLHPSNVLTGVEADIQFPNTVGGRGTRTSPLGISQASEMLQLSGSLRGRIGYVFEDRLWYGFGGLAWASTRLNQTFLGDLSTDSSTIWRLGWTAGTGLEVRLTSNWAARLEYAFSRYRDTSHATLAPHGSSRFEIHNARLGLNYRLNDGRLDEKAIAAWAPLELDRFSFYGQTTYLHQYAPRFRAPYRGQNSLAPNQGRQTWDVTFYAGARLWDGAELWINPEIVQGFGLSGTLGIAGFTSGEAYKVGATVPYARIPRMFMRQTINFDGESQKVAGDINQFANTQSSNRLVITVGKFGVNDVFDTNKFAHDPRKDFMNWALIDTGTFDYAADAWGYTYGAAVEWYQGPWTVRGGLFDLSVVPNSSQLDPQFKQFQWVGELERRYDLFGRPGKVALTAFLSRGRMGKFEEATAQALVTGEPADISSVRRYRGRSGISVNTEQQITDDLGMFMRAGLADGKVEPYEFTDIDRTIAAGVSVSGKSWGRDEDTFGLAGVVNRISAPHQRFLDHGGLGILVGDGKLPNPGTEKILEVYYSFPVSLWRVTLDYQFIANPAYNQDRGPVSVFGARLRGQF